MFMKKVMIMVAGMGFLLFLAGCNTGIRVSDGYGHTLSGAVYTGGIQGGRSEQNLEILKRPYKHLGRVSGTSSQSNILMIVAFGDASIEAAQQDALQKVKNADTLINRNFDIKRMSVLGLFSTATLRVTGDAIQFTDKK